ncbi:MAG: DinB family protein, partial [Aggregatilineales bacterium]
MNINAIKLMFAYNNWANEKILATAKKITLEQLTTKQDVSWGSLRGTLVHTLDCEWGWRVLLQHGENVPVLNADDFPDVASIRTHWHKEETAWDAYLDSLSDDDVDDIITYGSPDNKRSQTLWHCLYHVVNHGMQHRSECAVMLTNFGQSPGEIDFAQFMNGREDQTPFALDDIKRIHAYHDWANDRILTMAENVTPEQLTAPQ